MEAKLEFTSTFAASALLQSVSKYANALTFERIGELSATERYTAVRKASSSGRERLRTDFTSSAGNGSAFASCTGSMAEPFGSTLRLFTIGRTTKSDACVESVLIEYTDSSHSFSSSFSSPLGTIAKAIGSSSSFASSSFSSSSMVSSKSDGIVRCFHGVFAIIVRLSRPPFSICSLFPPRGGDFSSALSPPADRRLSRSDFFLLPFGVSGLKIITEPFFFFLVFSSSFSSSSSPFAPSTS